MKFSVPKTLTGSFLPTILINWVFGMGLAEYPMGRPRRVISVCWSMINFLIYLGFVRMANLSEIKKVKGSRIAADSYRINAYFFIAFIATSMCLAQIRSKILKDNFTELSRINDRLKILGIPYDYEVTFKSQIIHLIAVSIYVFIIMVLDFGNGGIDFPTETSRFGFCFAFYYKLLFTFVVDYSFIGSVRYFGNRFERLNNLLEESISLEKTETMLTRTSINQCSRYSLIINEIHGYNLKAVEAANRRWLLYVVRETRRIHRDLCKMMRQINRGFGIQMLFSVAFSFGIIITLLYTSYIFIISSFSSGSIIDNWLSGMIAVLWITFFSLKVLLIVDVSETATCEANRTRELITRLRDTTACDEDIHDEISIFSLQLIQNPLNLTASGFFTLNYELVCGMIGSVTTYLVIMIQMRSIYDPDNVDFTDNSTILVQMNSTDENDSITSETYL